MTSAFVGAFALERAVGCSQLQRELGVLHHVNVVLFSAKLSLNCVRCSNRLVRHVRCVGRAVREFKPKSSF